MVKPTERLHVLLAWNDEIRVWRGIYRWYEPRENERKTLGLKKYPYIKWEKEIPPNEDQPYYDACPVLRVRTDMHEGFFGYQNKTHYFFVTISGKLYACGKHGDKQRTQLLWNDANSPIRAIIHDSDSHRTFAFTRAAGRADNPGRNVGFALDAKLKPIVYDPKRIPQWRPSDPLPAMMEYTQIILWNVPPADWHAPIGGITAQQRQQWWADLTSTEAVKAHRAAWNLMAGAVDTVAFLKAHLHPVPVEMQNDLSNF